MANVMEVKVPDIGDFKDVSIIEVMVKPGDTVKPEDPLITLESDKATMDVPAPAAGTVQDLKVKVGDTVSEGSPILVLQTDGAGAQTAAPVRPEIASPPPPTPAPGGVADVHVPDIGDFKDVPIIEVMVKPGDTVKPEDPLITLESDKATMDVPAPLGGVVQDVRVKVGDKVSEGSLILTLKTDVPATKGAAQPAAPAPSAALAPAAAPAPPPPPLEAAPAPTPAPTPAPGSAPALAPVNEAAFAVAYASPSVRLFARELGVDLGQVKGSGDKGRILREDVLAYVKGELAKPRGAPAPAPAGAGPISGPGFEILPWPQIDFTKFGPVERKPLLRIKKISGANLARNWVMIPHVTQFDEADVTELEEFRKATNEAHAKQNVKVTLLAFILKASVAALQKYPEFNASLDGDDLVLKKYYHIGFAADTPQGLVVPVLRDVDQKGVVQIAKEMGELSALARDGKLKPTDMQGGCFTVSSLGGIGGTAFTPIINAPEIAILGVSRSTLKPVHQDRAFVPRLMLPLSLSYDHRVIDGAAAARFTTYLASVLSDMRRVLW
jgi:pyruvate dehydrogenase E2 component (dihydrolipoamide acetyltransferase)